MKYDIFEVTYYEENISVCQLSNETTWKFKQWTNDFFGIRLRQVFNPSDHSIYHFIGFLKDENKQYKEVSSVEFNKAVERSKTKLASLL